MKKIFVLSAPKSGHHAVARWLLSQYPNFNIFNFKEVGERTFNQFVNKKYLYYYAQYEPDIKLTAKIDRMVVSNEGSPYDKTIIPKYVNMAHENHFNTIFVIRDFANWLASLICGDYRNGEIIDDFDKYKMLIDYYIQLLDIALEHDYISYSKWVESREYRHEICFKFNLNFTDTGYEQISPEGHGAFENNDFNHRYMDAFKILPDHLLNFYIDVLRTHKYLTRLSPYICQIKYDIKFMEII